MMQISTEGLSFIKSWEGFRAEVYHDVAGIPTVGYGHVVKPGEHFEVLTEQQGAALLLRDVQRFEAAVNIYVTVALTQKQFDALVSFCFNIGVTAFRASTLLRLLNEGNYYSAARQLPRWNRSGGKKVQGLVNRRAAERKMFEQGDSHV